MRLQRRVILRIPFLIVLSVCSLASAGFSSQNVQIQMSASGFIEYTTQQKSGPVFGWGGYITTVAEVIPILEDLYDDGYTAIRYWARPYWCYGQSSHNLDFDVLDHLVEEAAERGITVYIDCEHNYPPSDYITTANRQEWIDDVIEVGLRYKDEPHVVLEPVNEYTGTNQVSLYDWGMQQIRAAGIHLPLLWNFWWNQPNAALNDPDNNYAIGRHLYGGSSLDNYNPSTPMKLEDAVADSGVANSMYKYFDSPTENLYLQRALQLGIPNGYVVSEMGPTDNENLVGNPSVGNMAYAMQFLREAASHNVSVICYRIGDSSKKSLYEQKAQEYFQEDFFTPPPN